MPCLRTISSFLFAYSDAHHLYYPTISHNRSGEPMAITSFSSTARTSSLAVGTNRTPPNRYIYIRILSCSFRISSLEQIILWATMFRSIPMNKDRRLIDIEMIFHIDSSLPQSTDHKNVHAAFCFRSLTASSASVSHIPLTVCHFCFVSSSLCLIISISLTAGQVEIASRK